MKAVEDRNASIVALLNEVRSRLPELEKQLKEVRGHWTYEDGIYRFYHHSFKVFNLKSTTREIVGTLQSLAPGATLNKKFMEIFADSERRRFVQDKDPKIDTNSNWARDVRPVVEAFMHALYFLEMAVKYGKEMTDEGLKGAMPSGWAAFLYLYDLR